MLVDLAEVIGISGVGSDDTGRQSIFSVSGVMANKKTKRAKMRIIKRFVFLLLLLVVWLLIYRNPVRSAGLENAIRSASRPRVASLLLARYNMTLTFQYQKIEKKQKA